MVTTSGKNPADLLTKLLPMTTVDTWKNRRNCDLGGGGGRTSHVWNIGMDARVRERVENTLACAYERSRE